MTDSKTATECLRELLDERGVKYTANDGKHVKETCWPYMGEPIAAFAEFDNGITRFACDTWCFTPEQAVAATLGSVDCAKCAEGLGEYADSLCDPLKDRTDKLLRCLESDYGITASWDGLRKVWLTERAERIREEVEHG